MTAITPDPFTPGYRLTDGTQLNYQSANPSWSISGPISATAGGTMLTSTKITFTITNVTAAATPGAGVTLPQALPGRLLIIANNSTNDIRVFAEGNSTINGVSGQIGVLVQQGTAGFMTALATQQWGFLNIVTPSPVTPIYQGLVGFLYSDGTNPITAYSLLPIANLPLTIDQCRNSLINFSGTAGTSGTVWLSIVENDLAANHNDSQDATAIRYWGAFWPPGGVAWTYVRTVLKAYFSWSDATADARILAAQTYAYTNR
jgi:hypothetical protein